MSAYAKIIGKNQGHYPYRMGLNSLKYNNEIFDASPQCIKGGLYYCKLENILDYLNYGHTLCLVSIPSDAQVVQVENKFKTDRLMIDQMFDLRDVETWKFLERHDVFKPKLNSTLGIVVTDILGTVVEKGYLDAVKFLVDKGADVQAYDNYAICLAAQNGHLDMAKFLVDRGADVQADNNYAVLHASKHGHLDMVKFLIDKGADGRVCNNHTTDMDMAIVCAESGALSSRRLI